MRNQRARPSRRGSLYVSRYTVRYLWITAPSSSRQLPHLYRNLLRVDTPTNMVVQPVKEGGELAAVRRRRARFTKVT